VRSAAYARAVRPALAVLAALAGASAVAESPRLTVSGPRWVIAGSDVTVTVTTAGALAVARPPVLLTVSVDGVAVARVEATPPQTRVTLPWRSLPAGRHEIGVKTGSVRATLGMEVLPRRPVWIALGFLGLAVGALLGLWRRARRARAG
jgi:hypothetical protein